MMTHRSNERRRKAAHTQGGQHCRAFGVSTLDGETDSESIERRRRASAELGEPSPAELRAIEKFNRELQTAIDAVDWSQSFGCFRTQPYSHEPHRKVQLASTFVPNRTQSYT